MADMTSLMFLQSLIMRVPRPQTTAHLLSHPQALCRIGCGVMLLRSPTPVLENRFDTRVVI